MITNNSITIYHLVGKKYERYIVSPVYWTSFQKQYITDMGMSRADIFKIRIPVESKDVDGRTYGKEPDETHWTVKKGDLVVRGSLAIDIKSRSDLTGIVEFGKVTDLSVNGFGLNPHIRIGADA